MPASPPLGMSVPVPLWAERKNRRSPGYAGALQPPRQGVYMETIMNFSPRISRRAFLAGSASVGAIAVMHPFAVMAQANQAHLRIIETTDIHVAVLPYDYYADAPNDTMGLARTASIIEQIR